jgi:hypothetical protein
MQWAAAWGVTCQRLRLACRHADMLTCSDRILLRRAFLMDCRRPPVIACPLETTDHDQMVATDAHRNRSLRVCGHILWPV